MKLQAIIDNDRHGGWRVTAMARSRLKKIQIAISLYDTGGFTNWMVESGMPFLAKHPHQRLWTKSSKANVYFARFKPEHRGARMRNGKEEPVKVQFIFQKSDWPLIESYIRLAWPFVKIGRYVKRKP
jgi:hypothetical protein